MNLPDELFISIFSYLDLHTLALSAWLVSKRWHALANDSHLWKRFCIEAGVPHINPAYNGDWRRWLQSSIRSTYCWELYDIVLLDETNCLLVNNAETHKNLRVTPCQWYSIKLGTNVSGLVEEAFEVNLRFAFQTSWDSVNSLEDYLSNMLEAVMSAHGIKRTIIIIRGIGLDVLRRRVGEERMLNVVLRTLASCAPQSGLCYYSCGELKVGLYFQHEAVAEARQVINIEPFKVPPNWGRGENTDACFRELQIEWL